MLQMGIFSQGKNERSGECKGNLLVSEVRLPADQVGYSREGSAVVWCFGLESGIHRCEDRR